MLVKYNTFNIKKRKVLIYMKTIPDYLNTLSNNDFDNLELIFTNHYIKFIKIYRILESYFDDVDSLSYYHDDNILTVNSTFAKKKSKSIIKELSASIDFLDNTDIDVSDNTVSISICNCIEEVTTE